MNRYDAMIHCHREDGGPTGGDPSRGVEGDYRSIISQLVSSILKDTLLRISYTEHQQITIPHVQRSNIRVKINVESSVR